MVGKYLKSFDGTKIFYEYFEGKKTLPTLVFIHGWMSNWTVWKREIEFFKSRGFQIIAIDLRGHGKSDKPDEKEKYKIEYFAKDVRLVCENEKIKEIILIGHSMGGMTSLVTYELFPRSIKSLILVNTTYTNPLQNREIQIEKATPFLKHVIDFIEDNVHIKDKHFRHLKEEDLSKYNKLGIIDEVHEALLTSPLKSVLACLEAMFEYDVTGILPKIKVPVLIIASYVDETLPLIDSLKLDQKIPDEKLVVLTDTHHLSILENPNEVDESIAKFLRTRFGYKF